MAVARLAKKARRPLVRVKGTKRVPLPKMLKMPISYKTGRRRSSRHPS